MEFVCPQPLIWNDTHKKLSEFYSKNKERISNPPPIPLILNGWIYSTDYQKKLRWEETIKWAQINDCGYLIPALRGSERYMVNEIKPTLIQEEDPYGPIDVDDDADSDLYSDYPEDEDGLKYDLKERDLKCREVIKQAGIEAEKNLLGKEPNLKDMEGYCQFFWDEKKRILKEKYNIDWKTPQELNPLTLFD